MGDEENESTPNGAETEMTVIREEDPIEGDDVSTAIDVSDDESASRAKKIPGYKNKDGAKIIEEANNSNGTDVEIKVQKLGLNPQLKSPKSPKSKSDKGKENEEKKPQMQDETFK